MSYESLLFKGRIRSQLMKPEEPEQPFFDQLSWLQYSLYITNCTKHPSNEMYQEMFLAGWIHREMVTDEWLVKLQTHDISFEFIDYGTCTSKSFYSFDWRKKLVLYEILSKWWFGEDPIPLECPPWTLHIRQHRDLSFTQRMRQWFQECQGQFLEVYERLSMEDHAYLDLMMAHCECRDLHSQPPLVEKKDLDKHYGGTLEYEHFYPQMESGDFIEFVLINFHNPMDRSLYSTLLSILSRKK